MLRNSLPNSHGRIVHYRILKATLIENVNVLQVLYQWQIRYFDSLASHHSEKFVNGYRVLEFLILVIPTTSSKGTPPKILYANVQSTPLGVTPRSHNPFFGLLQHGAVL
ncbi:unnamed protein product [Albugo candida]|uniref:Uncharacterized protein n=1 Tax=Albugo candida TaxID=65357 RepID=A0A024FWI7_9STRA|nr:unnamed protein product [Albugo candida]|eukprot:CCI11523.1 unnamed protein product [Albugo candida]